MTFHLTYVHIILVRFGLLSGHLLGNRKIAFKSNICESVDFHKNALIK